jgi:hypothetical protein
MDRPAAVRFQQPRVVDVDKTPDAGQSSAVAVLSVSQIGHRTPDNHQQRQFRARGDILRSVWMTCLDRILRSTVQSSETPGWTTRSHKVNKALG